MIGQLWAWFCRGEISPLKQFGDRVSIPLNKFLPDRASPELKLSACVDWQCTPAADKLVYLLTRDKHILHGGKLGSLGSTHGTRNKFMSELEAHRHREIMNTPSMKVSKRLARALTGNAFQAS